MMFELKEKLFLILNGPVLGGEISFSTLFPCRGEERSYETSQIMSLSVCRLIPGRAIPRSRNVNWCIPLLIQSLYSKRKAKLGPLIEAHLSVLIEFNYNLY